MLEKVPSSFTSEAWPESWLFKCLYWLPKYRSWPNTSHCFHRTLATLIQSKQKRAQTWCLCCLVSVEFTGAHISPDVRKRWLWTTYKTNSTQNFLAVSTMTSPSLLWMSITDRQSDHKQTGQSKLSNAWSKTGHRRKKCQFSEPDNKTLKVLDNRTL